MKKLLALTLSLLMVLAVVPMVMVSAENYSVVLFTMDEDSRPSDVGVTSRADYTSFVDSGEEGYGSVLKVLRTGNRGTIQDQALGFKLPANTWTGYGTPVSITFDARTDTGNINFGPNDTSEYINLNPSITASTVSGFTAPIGDFSSTWKTYTFDLTSAKSKEAIANGYLYLCFRNTWGNNSCNYFYMDNITLNYAPFVGTFSGGVEGDQVINADANGALTTPSATLAEGEFAGWTTAEDPETIIPANQVINLTKDTVYYATAAERAQQDAPAAPTVASKTGTSVTLVANAAYQYSMDGEIWQDSNVFEGLQPGTAYTFYQRLKATPNAYASPASPAATIETAVIHFWKFYTTSSSVPSDFNVVTTPASGAGSLSVGTHSDDGVPSALYTSRSLVVGDKLTFTSKLNLIPGIYKATFQVRTYSGRAKTNISINGREYGEFNAGQNSNGKGQKFVLFEDLTVNEEGPAVVEFTATTSGSCYIEGMHFEKVGDVEVEDENEVEVSMKSGASIRLNNKNGIRFYTTVDAAKIAELKAAGKEVTMGTIIAPEDLIEGEFTHEDVHAEVEFTSSEYFEENTIVGSIVSIKETNIGRKFVGRGYVCVDGTYYYAEMNDNARSLKGIATAYAADGYPGATDEQKELVDSWAAAADWSAQ